jgi:hypothetical protein
LSYKRKNSLTVSFMQGTKKDGIASNNSVFCCGIHG